MAAQKAKYLRSEERNHIFKVGDHEIPIKKDYLKKNNLELVAIDNPGAFYIDYHVDKNQNIKVNSITKDIFGNPEDNFYLRLNRSPVYKNFEEPKSQLLKQFQVPEFDAEQLKELNFRQLIHSQAACVGLPNRLEVNSGERQFNDFKEEYEGAKDFASDWRVIPGLGNASVFETGMTLHHIYGFPYLPASSVKGIVRSWLIQEYFGNPESDKVPEWEKEYPLVNAEYRAYQDLGFCYLFGALRETFYYEFDQENGKPEGQIDKESNEKRNKPQQKLTALARKYEKENKKFEGHIGNLVFFDALPTTPPTIETDIMNPHYPKYYNGNQPPADWQSPTPIFFLTVKNTTFQFLFGIRKGVVKQELDYLKPDKTWFTHPEGNSMNKTGTAVQVISALLKEALQYHGIGAKTAVGYGLMKSQ